MPKRLPSGDSGVAPGAGETSTATETATTASSAGGRRVRHADQRELFCQYVVQGYSYRDAARLAGYSPNGNAQTLVKAASDLARRPDVVARMAELRALATDATVMPLLERKRRLSEIAAANLTDFVDDDGMVTLRPSPALAEFAVSHNRYGENRRITVRDPIAAIAELNKIEHVYEEQRGPNIINAIQITVVYDDAPGK